MIPWFLSVLREMILQRYAALTTGHTPCTYNANPGAHDDLFPTCQIADPLHAPSHHLLAHPLPICSLFPAALEEL